MFINLTAKAIEMAKSEYRAAHTYGTDAYDSLQEVRKAYPGFRVVIKEKKRTDHLKGLNVAYMEKHIQAHDDEERSIWKEFMTLRGLDESGNKAELAGAASVGELRMWFLHQFPEIKARRMASSRMALLCSITKVCTG